MTRSALLLSTTPLLAAALLAACGSEPETAAAPGPEPEVRTVTFDEATLPHARLPGTVTPRAYRIDMVIDPDADTLTGEVEIDVDITDPVNSFFIHGKEMTITSATLASGTDIIPLMADNVPLELAPSGLIRLSADDRLPLGDGTLSLAYETPYNLALNSAYKVVRPGEEEGTQDAYILTQMEPVGAREAFPGFDEPAFKVPFTLSITAPEEDFVYANTPVVEETPTDDGRVRHEFATTRPLPTYLIAFGVGPYDVVDWGDIPPNAVRRRPLAQRGITARGSGEEIVRGLDGTEPILTALEDYFGSEYPYEKLDIIAAPDYAFGAMENPGAIVYREYLMLLADDAPLSQVRAYNGVHSHELAHQWFGNLVTPLWWEDIWLNEAFATWMGNKGTAMAYPDGNYDRRTLNAALGAMNIDSLASTRRVREPLERTENVMDQFDGITYRKGGGVLSMFESFVGEDAFRDGVRLHMERYADDVASADDFFQSIADGSENPDVVAAMKSFVDQPGVPLVSVNVRCDVPGEAGEMLLEGTQLAFEQSRYAPLGSSITQGQTWQIPVCANLVFEDGTTSKSCTLLKENKDVANIDTESCPVAVTPNADGAGYYRFTLDSASWQNLFDNLDALNTKEVLTVQDSLTAAFRAGEVEPAVFIAGMEAFAEHPEYDVADKAGDLLGFMYDEFPDARDDLADLVSDMYADRYAASAGTDSLDGQLLVPTLAANLTRRAGDADLAAEFAAKGAAYLAGDTDAVAQNLLSRALREHAIADPEAAYAPLKAMVAGGSAFEKGAAVGALGSIRNDALAATLRNELLTDTATFTGRQAISVLGVLMRNEAQEAATWDWVKANFPAVVERAPDVRKPGLPGLARGFCSEAERAEVNAFFEANAELIPGYTRTLSQVDENIALCSAFKAEVGEAIVAALAARGEVDDSE